MIAMLRGVYRAMKAMVFGSRAEAEGVPYPIPEVSGTPVDDEECPVSIPDSDTTIVQIPEISLEPEIVAESPPLTNEEVGDTTPVQAPEISGIPATVAGSVTPDTGDADAAPVTTVSNTWAVRTIVDPVFVKVGRMYLDEGDLVIRSDRDSRVFLLQKEEIDQAFAGEDVPILLLDLSATVGIAHLSTSGRALNFVIDRQLHTVPLRSLIPVLNGKTRKAPLFVPKEDVAPDPQ